MKRFRWQIGLVALLAVLGVSVSVAMGAFNSSPRIVPVTSPSSNTSLAKPGQGVAAPDSAQSGAFSAFRRAQTPKDRSLDANDAALQTLATAQVSSQVNPSQARNVYSDSQGNSVFLVPGAGTLCVLAASNGFGQGTSCASTEQAIGHGLGFVYYSTSASGDVSDVTLGGVLPDGARDVEITDNAGHATAVPLSANNGYWLTVANPVNMVWTAADGTTHQMSWLTPRVVGS